MIGNVVLESREGMPFPEFVAKYKESLKGKHGIYVVQTNLEQDLDSNGRITRGKNYSGSVVKVGRSQGTFISRLSEYAAHSGGKRMSASDQGGIRVLFIMTLPQKNALTTGKSLTVRFEKQLLDVLKEKYGYIKYRSDERFRVNIDELFNIITELQLEKGDDDEEFVRRSERLGGESLMWLTKDLENPNNLKLHFHKDFDEIMKKYKHQISKRFTGLTSGYIPPTEVSRYIQQIQYMRDRDGSDVVNNININNIDDGDESVDIRHLYARRDIDNPQANGEGGGDNQSYFSIGNFVNTPTQSYNGSHASSAQTSSQPSPQTSSQTSQEVSPSSLRALAREFSLYENPSFSPLRANAREFTPIDRRRQTMFGPNFPTMTQ